MFVSNIVNAVEHGSERKFECFCSGETHQQSLYVQPKELQDTDLNFSHLVYSYSPDFTSIASYNTFMSNTGSSKYYQLADYCSVKTTLEKIHHIVQSHTFKVGCNEHFFLKSDPTAKSTFIHTSVVWPLIRITISRPDKTIVVNRGKRRVKIYEKLFQQEIGHGITGCLPVCRVIVDSKNNLVSAYPVRHFSVI